MNYELCHRWCQIKVSLKYKVDETKSGWAAYTCPPLALQCSFQSLSESWQPLTTSCVIMEVEMKRKMILFMLFSFTSAEIRFGVSQDLIIETIFSVIIFAGWNYWAPKHLHHTKTSNLSEMTLWLENPLCYYSDHYEWIMMNIICILPECPASNISPYTCCYRVGLKGSFPV